jgi:signal transduction histidine kinase
MKVGAQRIREIVLSLRNFSRMDEAEMKDVNIHEGIDSTLMILEHRIKATSHRPAIQVIKKYGNLPLVECYAGQLNQVFMNILANAIDALDEAVGNSEWGVGRQMCKAAKDNQGDEGEINNQCPMPQIRIETEISEKQVVIRMADNGLGIPQSIKQRLFDPFFSTKPIGKGTGMGLSISYQIISEKHRGSLKCISQPGSGAEFVITIPLSQN